MGQIRSGRQAKIIHSSILKCFVCYFWIPSTSTERMKNKKIRTFNVTFAKPYKEESIAKRILGKNKSEKIVHVPHSSVVIQIAMSPASTLPFDRLPKAASELCFQNFPTRCEDRHDDEKRKSEKNSSTFSIENILIQWGNGK